MVNAQNRKVPLKIKVKAARDFLYDSSAYFSTFSGVKSFLWALRMVI